MVSYYNGIQNNTDPSWWKDRCLRWNVIWVSVTALTHVVTGYDASLTGALQAVPMFYKSFPTLKSDPGMLGIANALLFLPGLLVPFFSAWLTDKVGRKIPVITCTVGLIIGAIVQATAVGRLGQFMAGRAIMGSASALGGLAGLALCAELCHPRFRAQATSMQVAVYYIGGILSSWITYGSLNNMPTSHLSWQIPTYCQIILPGLLLPFLCIIPQSPRWLISKGRIEEARVVFAKQHANGDIDDPLVHVEVDEVIRALEFERSNKTSWAALWSTKGNRWRMFVVIHTAAGAQLGGSGIVSYYLVPVLKLVGITSYTEQTLISACLNIWNFFLATGASFSIEKVGRRVLWLLSTGIMCLALCVVTGLSATFVTQPTPAIGRATIAFLFIFFGGYDLAWSPLNSAYTVEVLSYSIRAKGLAVWTFTTYASLSFNTWVNPKALASIGWKYYIVYVCVLVYLFTIIWFTYPETKGKTLEEVSEVFDKGEIDLRAAAPAPVAEIKDDESANSSRKEAV